MKTSRLRSFVLILWCLMFLAGCGGGRPADQSNLPPVDDSARGGPARTAQTAPQSSIINKKNMVMLAGAAALYFMYKHHQKATAAAAGPDSQYYLSKNGRVYYRDAEHRAHWVTPPSQGIAVPADEAQQYQAYQGYNGQQTGKDLTGLGRD